jgi:hypothetical protein
MEWFKKSFTTQSKEILKRDVYNSDEYKFSRKSMIDNVLKSNLYSSLGLG